MEGRKKSGHKQIKHFHFYVCVSFEKKKRTDGHVHSTGINRRLKKSALSYLFCFVTEK